MGCLAVIGFSLLGLVLFGPIGMLIVPIIALLMTIAKAVKS